MPLLEWWNEWRAPFLIDRAEVIIGSSERCALRLDRAAPEHARLSYDGSGSVWIEDLDTQEGTRRNGDYVYGRQPLAEGDRIEIGRVTLVFRLSGAVRPPAPTGESGPSPAAVDAAVRASSDMAVRVGPGQTRAGADAATRMPAELPPEVRAALAARDAARAPGGSAGGAVGGGVGGRSGTVGDAVERRSSGVDVAAGSGRSSAGGDADRGIADVDGSADRGNAGGGASRPAPSPVAGRGARTGTLMGLPTVTGDEFASREGSRSSSTFGSMYGAATNGVPTGPRPSANRGQPTPSMSGSERTSSASDIERTSLASGIARARGAVERTSSASDIERTSLASGIERARGAVERNTPAPVNEPLRTEMMQAIDFKALGIDPTAPPLSDPSVKMPSAKRTLIGIPAFKLPSESPTTPANAMRLGVGAVLEASDAPSAAQALAPPGRTPNPAQTAAAASSSTSPTSPAPATAATSAPSSALGAELRSNTASTARPDGSLSTMHPRRTPPPSSAPDAGEPPLSARKTALLEAPAPLPPPPSAGTPSALPAYQQPTPSYALAPSRAPHDTLSPGLVAALSRAAAFAAQVARLARQQPTLLRPLACNVYVATPLMAIFTASSFLVHSPAVAKALLAMGIFLLYFVDYTCSALTCSLVYDTSTGTEPSLRAARVRVEGALPGVLAFATGSAALDLATTWARERDDVLARLLLRLVRALWTTATYVILPTLILERATFGEALARSRVRMGHDPTGVGAGVVALSLASWLVGALCVPLAWIVLHLLSLVHPALGVFGVMAVVNFYWALTGWLKVAYATCFYLWALECERHGSADPALAPTPLRVALTRV